MSAELLPFSDKCATCPALQRCERYISITELRIEEVTDAYLAGMPEIFADEMMRASESDPDIIADEVLDRDGLMRLHIFEQGELITRLEESIGATRLHMDLLRLGCDGIARLRGVKSSTEYTVELCGSTYQKQGVFSEDEDVRVMRRKLDSDR